MVIMAGGSGTRLWPLSRKGTPKQLLNLFEGKSLLLNMGYSHPVRMEPVDGITYEIAQEEKARTQKIVISGIDKVKVGQVAADIRKVRKPEPYNGKGIRYDGEVVRLKAGKRAAAKK